MKYLICVVVMLSCGVSHAQELSSDMATIGQVTPQLYMTVRTCEDIAFELEGVKVAIGMLQIQRAAAQANYDAANLQFYTASADAMLNPLWQDYYRALAMYYGSIATWYGLQVSDIDYAIATQQGIVAKLLAEQVARGC